MAHAPDPYEQFRDYAHPERLVSGSWLYARLGTPGLRVVESDEDTLLYDIGHIPGAVRIDWHQDLSEPATRDYITAEQFAALMRKHGIHEDDTVVIYGDRANSWAAFALWVFTMFGHKDVRLLDGGRDAWIAEERDTSYIVPEYPHSNYPIPTRNDEPLRALARDTYAAIDKTQIVDVREPEEFLGETTHAQGYPDDTVTRAGHIPSAINVPWEKTVYANSRFRSYEELSELYSSLIPDTDTITYCRFGDRAAHTWFVLTYLLGFDRVRNYDGAWVEWGNMVGMPIVRKQTDTTNT